MVNANQQRIRKPSTKHRHSSLHHSAVALAVAACFSGNLALANPTAPTVVHGTASFATAGNILNVTNSQNAIINWGSFSIGINELTRFIQPSALSAVLNRVTGQDPSAILGALQSNGSVFLLNPNGIMFGAGAQIDVAGLVASTLNLSNEDFLNNRMRFTDGAGAGSVVNQGSITGGSVYLVGNAVTNNGLITSPNGEVVLAAGNSVELVNPATPNLRVEIVAPDNEAKNLGTISAEAGRIGIYAGLIKQSGVISADSAVAEGGRIMLKSTKSTTLESTSAISARGTNGGTIEVLSSMTAGTTKVEGTLDVSAVPSSGSGNGGFIETSAANVQIGETTRVRSKGSNGGQSGLWLIDPENFTISAGGASQTSSGIGADTLQTNLNDAYGGSVSIATSAYGGEIGDLFVNAPVSWNSFNSLSLIAHNDVKVNQSISNAGTGTINLYAGWDGISPTSPAVTPGMGNVVIDAPVSSGGNILMTAGKDITVNKNLTAMAVTDIGVAIQLDAGRHIVVNNSTVSATGGASAAYGAGLGSVMMLATDDLTVTNSIIEARGGNTSNASYDGGYGDLYLQANNNGVLKITGSTLRATGGDGAPGSWSGGFADITLNAVNSASVEINGSLLNASGGAGGYRGGDSDIYINSATGVTIGSSTLQAVGGAGDYMQGQATVGIHANGGDLSISNSTISAQGGYWAEVDMSGNNVTISNSTVSATAPTGADGGEGNVNIYSPGNIDTGSSTVSAVGITFAEGGEGCCYYTTGVFINGGGNVNLGLVTSSDWVNVYSGGAITDGNAGLNVGALEAYLAGNNGVGSVANPLETQVSKLNVYSSSGGIGIINSGDVAIGSLYGGGGDVAIGSTGSLAIVDGGEGMASGNLLLGANGHLGIYGYVSASGALLLQSGGNIEIGNPLAYNSANAMGNSSAFAIAGGSLTLNPNMYGSASYLGSNGNTMVVTGGNVNVNQSFIYGNPDVMMTVGGVININGTMYNPAMIEAGSSYTINLLFPLLSGSGYFINGIEGVVFDPLTNTGFFANGSPAILGTNLLVTYGGALNIPTDALIVAMGESTKPPDPDKDKDIFSEKEDEDKKNAPVCR